MQFVEKTDYYNIYLLIAENSFYYPDILYVMNCCKQKLQSEVI